MRTLQALVRIAGASALLLFALTSHAATDRLVITGSSTIAPLAAEVAKRFEQQNPGVRIDVQTGGSSRGVADARSGLADIGMASRSLRDNEKDLLPHKIAMDGVGIILHKNNVINVLSDAQIKAIYQGQITNWKDVGGSDLAITVVNKAEGRSTLELFLHYTGLKNSQIRPQVVIGDNQQGIKSVAANPGAIGYVSIGTAEYEEQHGTPIKLIALRGVAATVANVKNGKFPLARPLNLVTRGVPTGLSKRFIDFATSADINDLVEGQYFVPLDH
ncbi:phosphate ABC transporter substrate-binding protein [Rhodoferax sp.]|uniref:phosphate ABC transporter substrate-binding protein n=1 Tax=Rhodoferax sp. TaxID=50421 RepID=UPI001A050277|nr:phosphate ABC transporter substrate-binding protein [Rhodoferax sp.]MBE0472641.1 phosphate ABC transporter substrate-binding protein [Rhodoferax sp.]